MARLPVVGGDLDSWGQVLIDFLRVNHGTDGALNAYTLAGLLAAGTAGRRARVTDDNRGLRTDTGTYWSAKGRVFYADDFDFSSSATGSANRTALQAAHDALPAAGGTIVLPAGTFSGTGLVTISKPSVRIVGQGPGATQLNWTGDAFKVEDTVDDLLFSLWVSDFALTEVSASTTAKGIDILSYVNRQAHIHRLELSGFGGGELLIRGGSNFQISNNYFSHNRAGSTGNALRIYENPTNGSATTFTVRANYFASTVAGANPMVKVEDLVSGRFIGNIYELVPAGVVGFRAEKVNPALACDGLTFIGEHFEAITGTAWQLHDCTNTAIFGVFGARPTLTWSTVAAANRYLIEMGVSGEPDLTNLRRALFGLSGPNDFSSNAAVQIGPIRGATNALAAFSTESGTAGTSGVWEVWAKDTGGTRRQIGQFSISLDTAHASQPGGEFSIDLFDAGGTLTQRFAADIDGVKLGESGTKFKKFLVGSVVYDPPNLADGASVSTTVTVTGATSGSVCMASHNAITVGGFQLTAIVTSANTVTVTITNHSGGAVDIGSGTLRVGVFQIS